MMVINTFSYPNVLIPLGTCANPNLQKINCSSDKRNEKNVGYNSKE